jgi:hypothetical protein
LGLGGCRWFGVQKRHALLNRVHGTASTALQRSLDDFLFVRFDNGFLEAIFFGQAARADEHVEQGLFHIFFLRSFWAKFLKNLDGLTGSFELRLIVVITGAASIAGKPG